MRILHLLASPVFSGPAENVAWLALAQRAFGHEVRVAVDSKRAEGSSEEPSAPRFAAWGLLDDGGLELSVKSSPRGILADVRRLARREDDVLHAHFSHDHWLARWGKRRGARLVRSIHAPRSLRWGMPWADAFTVPRPEDQVRLRGRPVEVLPALVDPRFTPSAEPAALREARGLRGSPLIGMVSTFQASRRHALGLEAFAALRSKRPEARLVLVGDGALELELRARTRALGLEEAVTFAGYRAGDDYVGWLQALDEVWVLGLGNDWSGRAAAQARACGVRVLAVDEGALSTWADEVIEASVADLVRASLETTRRSVALASHPEVARRILGLYGLPGADA